MTMSLQEISDRLEIQELLVDYTQAIDRRNWDALDDVFTDDAFIDYAETGGSAGDLPSTKEFLAQAMPMFKSFQRSGHGQDRRRRCGDRYVDPAQSDGAPQKAAHRARSSSACGTTTSSCAPRPAGGSRSASRRSATSTTRPRASRLRGSERAMKNRVTELLGVEHPIIQAPMGYIARAQLASAVSNAGALGIIETSSGQLDQVRDEIAKMRDLTDKPFGVNIAQLFVRDPGIVDFVHDQGVRFVTTSAGDRTVSPTRTTPG
jgi:hypothetical protein